MKWWVRLDSNQRSQKASDLQSDEIATIRLALIMDTVAGLEPTYLQEINLGLFPVIRMLYHISYTVVSCQPRVYYPELSGTAHSPAQIIGLTAIAPYASSW